MTCEKGHTTQMSGIDLCRRLHFLGEKLDCPECYEQLKLGGITDGPLMSDEQKKQQQEEYLKWSQEQKRERSRKEHEYMVEGALGW